jgi:hypothetical protein
MAAKKQAKPNKGADALKAKRELFCQYFAKNSELFGNATLSYAEAFDYRLDELPDDDAVYEQVEDETTGEIGDGKLIQPSTRARAYHVCGVESSKLLKKPEIQERITVLLNELLKDEIVDAELAKLIKQDGELPVKIRAINEYNKVRGRIIDKSQEVGPLPFGESDLAALIATLPQERQDYYYGVITALTEEAELRRSASASEIGFTR